MIICKCHKIYQIKSCYIAFQISRYILYSIYFQVTCNIRGVIFSKKVPSGLQYKKIYTFYKYMVNTVQVVKNMIKVDSALLSP